MDQPLQAWSQVAHPCRITPRRSSLRMCPCRPARTPAGSHEPTWMVKIAWRGFNTSLGRMRQIWKTGRVLACLYPFSRYNSSFRSFRTRGGQRAIARKSNARKCLLSHHFRSQTCRSCVSGRRRFISGANAQMPPGAEAKCLLGAISARSAASLRAAGVPSWTVAPGARQDLFSSCPSDCLGSLGMISEGERCGPFSSRSRPAGGTCGRVPPGRRDLLSPRGK